MNYKEEEKLGGAKANLSTLKDASGGVDIAVYPVEFSRGLDWPDRRTVGVDVNKQTKQQQISPTPSAIEARIAL